MTIELPKEALARLRAEAARRGVRLDDLIADLADQLPASQVQTGGRRALAFVAAGASSGGITGRLDELLADGFGRD